MPVLVHVGALQRYVPGHQASPGQGLGLTTKALPKPDELYSKTHFFMLFSLQSFSIEDGVFLSSEQGHRHCFTHQTERLMTYQQAIKASWDQHTNLQSWFTPITEYTIATPYSLSFSTPNLALTHSKHMPWIWSLSTMLFGCLLQFYELFLDSSNLKWASRGGVNSATPP